MNNVDFDQKTLSHSSCSSQKRKEAEKKAALLLLQDENLMTRIFLQDRDISRQFNNNGLLIFQTNISPNSKLLLLLLLLHEKLHSAAFDRQWPPAKLTPTFFGVQLLVLCTTCTVVCTDAYKIKKRGKSLAVQSIIFQHLLV